MFTPTSPEKHPKRITWWTPSRMWVSSDPVVNCERYKSQLSCKVCHAVGHTIRSCQSIKATTVTEDDLLFNKLLIL